MQITALCFSPDGTNVVSGLLNGQVYFYEYDGLKYITQMDCRNSSGKYRKGAKVTGLSFLSREIGTNDSNNGNTNTTYGPRRISSVSKQQILVTTNDSRVRIYQIKDYSLQCKYKGVRNLSMQIKATFSEDGKYIICGSENGSIVVWNVEHTPNSYWIFKDQENKSESYESFECSQSQDIAVTNAIFAPTNCIRYLIQSLLNISNDGNEKKDQILSSLDYNEMCTKIIATADYEGNIRIFVNGLA
jgi:WD40 repeat protein